MMLDSVKIKRLWAYLRPYWRLELLTFFVMAAIAGLALALPIAVKYLIDDLIPSLTQNATGQISLTPIAYFGLVLIGIYMANIIFSYGRDYLVAYIGANIIADMRSQLFAHLERLSLRFHQTHQVGEIMSRMLSDVSLIQNLLTSTLLMFLTNILLLIAISIYLLYTNWLLTLVAIIPVPITIILTNSFGKKLHFVSKNIQEMMATLSSRLQESLLSIKTVLSFGREATEKGKVDNILGGMTKLYINRSVMTSLATNMINFVNMIGPIVVLSWGTYMIAGGSMKLGALIAFYMLLTYLYSPIQSLAGVFIEVQTAMAPANRVFEYLDISPEIVEDRKPVILSKARGQIEFDNVSFRYNENGFALANFSLKIREKEQIALVGPSGSGKTTLINLIMRFYDPQSGIVALDGVDLRKLSISFLRKHIGLVDQDPLLFRTSIFNNIAFSNPDATLEDIIAAAKVANIHDFIVSLPNKYDSEVGERGVTLSGGEKQRICLARAVLMNPPFLILDEATSALDSNSEYLIQEALKKILADKTAIIIAHRLATVQNADRIIVLENGRIIGEGKHEKLMEESPLYRELAGHQLRI